MKKKILIVEDEVIVAMELKSGFEAMGYAADTVGSGEEAMESIALSRPDLVLMDIRLHGKMDGIETAEWIRDKHDIPVIYLTAYIDEETIERAKATEPYSYILKPFDMKELHVAIVIALYRHKIEKEKEKLTSELTNALARAKQLSGMISICSYCKKVRDDKGYWEEVETYIMKHADTEFSHGMCPDCAVKVVKEYEEVKKNRGSVPGLL